ncbi:MAG: agmatine deiminase family protein [Pseudomonadota bacterium]
MAYRMLPEWAPHKRTWMAWPNNPDTIEPIGTDEDAHRAWANVANAIARFEPVIMICNHGHGAHARTHLDGNVSILETELGDSWMRDFGPTFVVDDVTGALGAVDWTFNGWGGRTFPDCSADAEIAAFVARQAGAERIPSKLVNEGGGIHVDGQGTLFVTETVQMNRNRNPSWTRAEIEAELHARLGTNTTVWVPRGLLADTVAGGTDGHVDTLAAFVKPGVVVVHGQPDSAHPDHEAAKEIAAVMRAAKDAAGNPLEVIVLDAPTPTFDAHGDEETASYVNFSFVNGGIVLCAFGDPKDEDVAGLFRRLFNDREVVSVDAVPIFKGGGGVHCITQQEPLCAGNSNA